MKMEDSCYGNKRDKRLQDLMEELKKANDAEEVFPIQSKILSMVLWRLEECEEALNYPQGSTMKRFFM